MSTKKKLLALLLCVLILAATALGLIWHKQHYEMIDLKFYPKNTDILDLRGEKISISHYEKIRRRLDVKEIYWDIPLQGKAYPQDIQTLTLMELKEADLKAIGYFTDLKTVDARGCEEFDLLQKLKKTNPQLQVQYEVSIGGRKYPQDAVSVRADGMRPGEPELLQYLPDLTEVRIEGSADAQIMEEAMAICQQRNVAFLVVIGGEGREPDTVQLQLENATAEDLQLLWMLPRLRQVHIRNPKMEADVLMQTVSAMPNVKFTWEKEILGVWVSGEAKQIDLIQAISPEGAKAYELSRKADVHGGTDEIPWLFRADSDYPVPDLSAKTMDLIRQVEAAMDYFPNVEQVEMTGALLDNAAMAAFRDAHREEYKVVWTVQCGGIIARTDTPYFMPTKYHVYYFQDAESENLKYCEDLVCVDVGHMSIKHVEWAAFMPKLEYLILAHTDVRSIEPLRSCKNLKFLEVDWSAVKDFSPLLDCKNLEDLNLGNTYGNFEVIEQMTWLKNLWLIGCSRAAAYRLNQALGETAHVVVSGAATVDNGWRELPNYYAMRDIMNMYYMEW